MDKPKIIAVVGPTASGKSEVAVALAKKFDGEIISADSRQIYKGLNLGSGKVEGAWTTGVKTGAKPQFIYKDIVHHLIDEEDPNTQFSVAKFQKQAGQKIEEIFSRGKLPIICGGTAFWVDSVIFAETLPEVKPNLELRAELEKLSLDELFQKLLVLDPIRAQNIDNKNPRRLIRALEIVISTGKPVPEQNHDSKFNCLWLGIAVEKEKLEKNIEERLELRFKQGLVDEVQKLHDNGLSWERLEDFGLEYKFCALFLQGQISETELHELLFTAIKQYSKRQLTWWKRNPNINWSSDFSELEALAKSFVL